MSDNFIYLVKETSKHYTYNSWENPESAWKQVNLLNKNAKRENKRYRFYVEMVRKVKEVQ